MYTADVSFQYNSCKARYFSHFLCFKRFFQSEKLMYQNKHHLPLMLFTHRLLELSLCNLGDCRQNQRASWRKGASDNLPSKSKSSESPLELPLSYFMQSHYWAIISDYEEVVYAGSKSNHFFWRGYFDLKSF